MNWLLLVFAGLLEVVWAIGLKYTDGFSKPVPSVITVAAMVASFYFLSIAMRTIPLSIAYTVWVGIGMVGAVIVGVFVFKETLSMVKAISLLLIIAGIVGLKLSSVS
ncbi:DMT family transporter [Alteromonas ponticola]|uniref:Guanidinium exporter n=1 Tax=Alteromonas ponticola TaxID=2720613 RepID=A0ABX1R5D4_9ALTE|nr:quaternary ammonium compound efflux SMR transporter SugE [Alteromonas ponticola]NMH60337.1 quaternary ammonium compound efflux SMR transporter SugE [Alteromonas ponticola]